MYTRAESRSDRSSRYINADNAVIKHNLQLKPQKMRRGVAGSPSQCGKPGWRPQLQKQGCFLTSLGEAWLGSQALPGITRSNVLKELIRSTRHALSLHEACARSVVSQVFLNAVVSMLKESRYRYLGHRRIGWCEFAHCGNQYRVSSCFSRICVIVHAKITRTNCIAGASKVFSLRLVDCKQTLVTCESSCLVM